MNFNNEFNKYAIKHLNVNSMVLHDYQNFQNSRTPYIIEEREMRVTQMDVFSRLMRDRILWVAGVVDDDMSTVVQAQLMFLESVDKAKDITMMIDSPGGSVKSGLSIVDVMQYISPDIATTNGNPFFVIPPRFGKITNQDNILYPFKTNQLPSKRSYRPIAGAFRRV